jgi:hypothetical protein
MGEERNTYSSLEERFLESTKEIKKKQVLSTIVLMLDVITS